MNLFCLEFDKFVILYCLSFLYSTVSMGDLCNRLLEKLNVFRMAHYKSSIGRYDSFVQSLQFLLPRYFEVFKLIILETHWYELYTMSQFLVVDCLERAS